MNTNDFWWDNHSPALTCEWIAVPVQTAGDSAEKGEHQMVSIFVCGLHTVAWGGAIASPLPLTFILSHGKGICN